VSFATEDHKPTNAIEKERVEAAGGTVEYERVCGNLAVSRAVGDFCYKQGAGGCEAILRCASRRLPSCFNLIAHFPRQASPLRVSRLVLSLT
jgi:serine/threonine protein phosphatase PrpC